MWRTIREAIQSWGCTWRLLVAVAGLVGIYCLYLTFKHWVLKQ